MPEFDDITESGPTTLWAPSGSAPTGPEIELDPRPVHRGRGRGRRGAMLLAVLGIVGAVGFAMVKRPEPPLAEEPALCARFYEPLDEAARRALADQVGPEEACYEAAQRFLARTRPAGEPVAEPAGSRSAPQSALSGTSSTDPAADAPLSGLLNAGATPVPDPTTPGSADAASVADGAALSAAFLGLSVGGASVAAGAAAAASVPATDPQVDAAMDVAVTEVEHLLDKAIHASNEDLRQRSLEAQAFCFGRPGCEKTFIRGENYLAWAERGPKLLEQLTSGRVEDPYVKARLIAEFSDVVVEERLQEGDRRRIGTMAMKLADGAATIVEKKDTEHYALARLVLEAASKWESRPDEEGAEAAPNGEYAAALQILETEAARRFAKATLRNPLDVAELAEVRRMAPSGGPTALKIDEILYTDEPAVAAASTPDAAAP